MKTPKEIYAAYSIMPQLQLHQLRVAAVAKLVCDSFTGPIDTHNVTLACLFHDMGNIIKFDLSAFPEFLEPEGLAYWAGIKADYERRYGTDQHAATLAIGRELGLSSSVLSYIDCVAFSKSESVLTRGVWEEMVCEYADSRVSPHGVLSLDARLREARERYAKRTKQLDIAIVAPERFEELVEAEHEIERRLFEHAGMTPADITDETIAPLIGELSEYPVS